MRRPTLGAAVLALVSLLLSFSTAARAADDRVTFGIAPASAAGALDGRPFLSFGVSPGATAADHVVLVNYAKRPVTLTAVTTDAAATTDGSFSLLPSKEQPRDAGSWLRLSSTGPFALPAATSAGPGTVALPVTVTVPRNATPGDHVAGIAAVLTTRSAKPGANNVNLEQRVATRVYFRVSGPLRAQLVVERLRVEHHDGLWAGSATVTYRVRNTGNVKLGAHQFVEVHGWFGPTRRARPADVPLLFPGSSVDVTTQVREVWPAVRDTATVRLLPVRLQGDVDPELNEVTASARFWALPWVVLLVLVLVAGGEGYRRRRRSRRPAPSGRHARSRAKEAALVSFVAVTLLGPGTAHAADVPYDDPASAGSLTLCDAQGHEVRGGALTDRPLAAKAVLQSKAPDGYDGHEATATLLAFQPRQGVAPGQWSGEFVTGPSRWTGPVPAVAGALDDLTVGELANDFPPAWNGFLQLRVYLGAPGRQAYRLRYDTADIKVDGDRWTLVRGGGADCGAAKAVTVAQLLGVAPTSTPSPVPAKPRPATSTSATPAAALPGSSSSGPAAQRSAAGGGFVLPVAGGLLVALLTLGVTSLVRRRSTSPA